MASTTRSHARPRRKSQRNLSSFYFLGAIESSATLWASISLSLWLSNLCVPHHTSSITTRVRHLCTICPRPLKNKAQLTNSALGHLLRHPASGWVPARQSTEHQPAATPSGSKTGQCERHPTTGRRVSSLIPPQKWPCPGCRASIRGGRVCLDYAGLLQRPVTGSLFLWRLRLW